jgi:uncharacterized cupredoxin-like copper-binding protein
MAASETGTELRGHRERRRRRLVVSSEERGGIVTTWKRLLALATILPAALGTLAIRPAAAAPKPSSVMITARDYSFEAPNSVPGGTVKVTLDNQGAEDHHLNFVRLDDGVDQQALLGALMAGFQSSRDVASFKGGPNGAEPGRTATSTQQLEPGNYVIACLIPGPDGVPHVVKGMIQPITVEPAPEVAPPKSSKSSKSSKATTVVLDDYDFDPAPAFDGTGTIDIVNRGDELHELVVGKLGDGTTIADVVEWGSQPVFQPWDLPRPFTDPVGITVISPGVRNRVRLGDLAPGRYGLFCFLPGPDMVSHVALGMAYPFEVE